MERVVITGPTGWIGQALLALLHSAGDRDALRSGEGLALFGSRAGTIALANGLVVPVRQLAGITPDDVAGAQVVHLAYLTKDKVASLGETAFREGNQAIDNALLAAMDAAPPASLFVASSGAAKLAEAGNPEPYGVMKLAQEERFLAFGAAHGVPVLCGRIFNVAGPFINKLEAYAVSNFALQARERREIRIEARQPVFRSFLHVTDLCRMIRRALCGGVGRDQPVDLCGNQILEMQDIAELVADEVARDTGEKVAIVRGALNLAARSDYLGCPQETRVLAMELNIGLASVHAQVRDTLEWIKALQRPGVAEQVVLAAGGR